MDKLLFTIYVLKLVLFLSIIGCNNDTASEIDSDSDANKGLDGGPNGNTSDTNESCVST